MSSQKTSTGRPSSDVRPVDEEGGAPSDGLERGTYEIIRGRIEQYAGELRHSLQLLNAERQRVFGSIPTELIATDRITTANNCLPRDIVPVGDQFLFGFNVHIGLKSETHVEDVFACFRAAEKGFTETNASLLADPNFEHDFSQLYKYYKQAKFSKFALIGPHLFMVFHIGQKTTDIKAFKWLVADGALKYIDNRSEHEVQYPPQHAFEWIRTHRDLHRSGMHPHISIEDRVFVETVGGDLTIKIEDNTDDGQGIYREPVDDADQTLDDAEIFYAIVGNLVLLKIRPFREDHYRYFVFNEKLQTVVRLDSLAHSCVLLPESHGLIFCNGYYLQTGHHKTFPTEVGELLFEKTITAPNGEDYLYVFYSQMSGTYVLLSYNMIQQEVTTPIQCNGYSIFENGQLIYFKSEGTPQKHHGIQVWQTPFTKADRPVEGNNQSYLFKIGNRDIVRAMAESHEILSLIARNEPYADLYLDVVRKATDLLDSWFWISDEQAFNPGASISRIRETAIAAVDEFEKVRGIRANTASQLQATTAEVNKTVSTSNRGVYRTIDEYVQSLAALRAVRGRVISLRELKYIDVATTETLERQVRDESERLSQKCVEFLLRADSLKPYVDRVEQQNTAIDSLATVAEASELDKAVATSAKQLEMLIEIVSNLKIDDATKRTRIIDDISTIYSRINQTRALLKNKGKSLRSVEGAAEFGSQLKLLGQAVLNFLDVCDSPERCDEYLTRMMVQIEELEGRFAEFDEFIVQLAEKREEVYAAFDSRKLQLIEVRNRRATSLVTAAERILKGISTRVAGLESVDEINSYFAADLMIEKVRDIIRQLEELDESVKVDDIGSRLKTIREDSVRQLLDRNELFVGGQNLIKLGKHQFTVNVQPLDLTSVVRDDQLYFHLTGTNFFELVESPEIDQYRHLWDQSIVSENRDVYRGEYLVWRMIQEYAGIDQLVAHQPAELALVVLQFMSPRYTEGYIKGVHDHDASLILTTWLHMHRDLGLLRFPAEARALAVLFQAGKEASASYALLRSRICSVSAAQSLFGDRGARQRMLNQIAEEIEPLRQSIGITEAENSMAAAGFLFEEISRGAGHAHRNAIDLAHALIKRLKKEKQHDAFVELLGNLQASAEKFTLARDWLTGLASSRKENLATGIIEEAAALIVEGVIEDRQPVDGTIEKELDGLLGDHPRIDHGRYQFHFGHFQQRLARFCSTVVPGFLSLVESKKALLEKRRVALRLDEFKPRVLTSFVRNQLINDVYLPLIGDNLAKQIGAAGDAKRTDLMGLLLLISPPGYGKTTLMEYMANRLGLTFMKINGPAIGHQVTSLDPAEAPNASARDEVNKLNLALEMGDNVMIYVDDIQHCNAEFLQKFISLCDATRRIEGVFRGRSRTYDLRGRKVCVVMAGNPYTESGEKFQIPDMLANRADTYNLGDVIGDQQKVFELSYLENCLTSNATLATLNSRNRQDIYTIIRMAEDPQSVEQSVEGNFSVEEITEFVSVMRKLIAIRDIVLKVNQEYIASAAQADEYRTEPAFKLQGSYRDMNKLAERVVPIMNDQELLTLIVSHYENQAQTLTTGAQANLLKFRELIGLQDEDQKRRWDDIKRTFKRNLLLGTASGEDRVSQIIAQLTTLSQGLEDIRSTIDRGVGKLAIPKGEGDAKVLQTATLKQIGHAVDQLARFNESLAAIRELMATGVENQQVQSKAVSKAKAQPIEVVNKIPQSLSNIIEAQFRILQTWMGPLLKLGAAVPEAAALAGAANLTEKQYRSLLKKIQSESREITTDDES